MTDVVLISCSVEVRPPRRATTTGPPTFPESQFPFTRATIETRWIRFIISPIQGCIACGECGKNGKCCLKDGLNDIIDEVKAADGLILGAPVYFGTARGDMMNLIQRVSMVARVNGNWLSGKVGGPVVVARRGGLTSTLQEMLMSFFISDMIVCGSSYWNIAFGHAPGDVAKDAEGIATLEKFGDNVAKLIIQLRK